MNQAILEEVHIIERNTDVVEVIDKCSSLIHNLLGVVKSEHGADSVKEQGRLHCEYAKIGNLAQWYVRVWCEVEFDERVLVANRS